MRNKIFKIDVHHILLAITVVITGFSNSSWAGRDNREVIVLDDDARNFLVREMQQNVSGLQQALTALSKDDMDAVATALRPLGFQGMTDVPPTLMSSVPDGFKKIGMPTHMAFDRIADAAEAGATAKEILSSIAMTMNKCIACHAAYRVESE